LPAAQVPVSQIGLEQAPQRLGGRTARNARRSPPGHGAAAGVVGEKPAVSLSPQSADERIAELSGA
jgi:hypothetical protein